MDEGDLPYRAEYAKSGRASCKGCKTPIAKDSLRLAVMVQSPMFDGKQPNWHHFKCFFMKFRPASIADIAHYASLRYDDQKLIQDKLGAAPVNDAKEFRTEYAKSGKSTCRGCQAKIEKGVVRISKMYYDGAYGPAPGWFHVGCFVKDREELGYLLDAESLPGFNSLGVDDKQMLRSKIKKIKVEKRKAAQDETDGATSAKQAKKETDEEKALKKQNDLIFKYRDELKNNLSKKELQELLEFNEQDIPSGESSLLERLADCMTFGSLKRCPECKEGQLVFRSDAYICTGNVSAWTKCQYRTQDTERSKFKIPSEMAEAYPFLEKYKYVSRKRVFSKALAAAKAASNSSKAASLPLEKLEIVVSKTNAAAADIKKKVEALGGKVVSKLNEKTLCVISTEAEVKKKSKKIKEAEQLDVHVVSEEFLDSVSKGGAELLLNQHKLAPWGGDAGVRIEASQKKSLKSSKSESMYLKSGPSTMKLTVKGAAAVEPESGLEHIAHVYTKKDEIYSAVLGMVDVVRGTNSFYKLQLLESDRRDKYWIFRAWGRVGTTIGGNKLENFSTIMDAMMEFKRLYEEKTANMWEHRKKFVKQPGKFYPLDIDYNQEAATFDKKMKPGANSKLERAVQELICLLFDVDAIKKTMMEFEIDLKKMPLGKLSKKQIKEAYGVLTELQELVKNNGSETKFLDASNRFYTLIPHDFGMKKPPLLNDERIIKQKIDMLDSLLEIEVACSLLKGAEEDSTKDPIDVHYHQLKTDISPLDRNAEDFKLLQKYVQTTHAETHSSYDLQVMDIFKVDRHGEEKKFKPFKQLHNRKLLWHGSRITNFAGILSQGLRIAPPEAPVTGYMFGKGIYFADMVSKSANYCCTSKSNPVGILLLCEVALGNMYERTGAEYVTKLPPNTHSTKGIGMTSPDPSNKIVTPEGVEIPLGPAKKNDPAFRSSLLYNEYIVYDTAQVNIKYLLKVNFKYKY